MIMVVQYLHSEILKMKIELSNKQSIINTYRNMQKVNEQKIRELQHEVKFQSHLAIIANATWKEDAMKIKELENQLAWEKKLNKSMMDCIMADGK